MTVKQLYEYATKHNYLDKDVYTVIDIIDRDINFNPIKDTSTSYSNSNTVDFNTLIEYSIDDLLYLLNN